MVYLDALCTVSKRLPKPRLEDILKTEDEDEDVLTLRRDNLGLKGGGCSSMNSLVPSYYLVKYSILNQLITHQCQDKPVAALLVRTIDHIRQLRPSLDKKKIVLRLCLYYRDIDVDELRKQQNQ